MLCSAIAMLRQTRRRISVWASTASCHIAYVPYALLKASVSRLLPVRAIAKRGPLTAVQYERIDYRFVHFLMLVRSSLQPGCKSRLFVMVLTQRRSQVGVDIVSYLFLLRLTSIKNIEGLGQLKSGTCERTILPKATPKPSSVPCSPYV